MAECELELTFPTKFQGDQSFPGLKEPPVKKSDNAKRLANKGTAGIPRIEASGCSCSHQSLF